MGVKSDTLLTLSRAPGLCGTCRHANRGTVDFQEGHVFCELGGAARHVNFPCDQQVPLTRAVAAAPETYYCYEAFDGRNGTWGRLQDARMLAQDADEEMRRALRADIPFVPADAAR